MRSVFPHTALVCRVALMAIVAALWGANPAEASSGRAGCCRPERKAAAPCCCCPAMPRTAATVADAPRTDAVQTPLSCRCLPTESAPADRSGSVVLSDPPSEQVAELDSAFTNPLGSADFTPAPSLAAKPTRTPLYLRLSRLRT